MCLLTAHSRQRVEDGKAEKEKEICRLRTKGLWGRNRRGAERRATAVPRQATSRKIQSTLEARAAQKRKRKRKTQMKCHFSVQCQQQWQSKIYRRRQADTLGAPPTFIVWIHGTVCEWFSLLLLLSLKHETFNCQVAANCRQHYLDNGQMATDNRQLPIGNWLLTTCGLRLGCNRIYQMHDN